MAVRAQTASGEEISVFGKKTDYHIPKLTRFQRLVDSKPHSHRAKFAVLNQLLRKLSPKFATFDLELGLAPALYQ